MQIKKIPKLKRSRENGYIKYLTDKEFGKIRRYVQRLNSPSLKMCIKIMMYLGIRVGEAIRLQRSNFNHGKDVKSFSKLIFRTEKSFRVLERRIPESLRQELKEYYLKHNWRMVKEDPKNNQSRYLFFANFRNSSKNKHIQRSTINFLFGRMRRSLGLNEIYSICRDGKRLHRVSPHTLRHYALWKYYQASGNDLVMAQQMIGHKKITTTANYINALKSGNNELNIIEKSFNFR